MERLLSARHVAEYLGIHIKTLYKMLRENRIPLAFVRLTGNKIAFRPAEVERFIAAREVNRDGSGRVKKKTRKYGYPADPRLRGLMLTAKTMSDEEAQQFFAGVRRDEFGNIWSNPDLE